MISPSEEHRRSLRELLRRDLNVAIFLGLTESEWRKTVEREANGIMLERARFSEIDTKEFVRKLNEVRP